MSFMVNTKGIESKKLLQRAAFSGWPKLLKNDELADLDDVRAYGHKAERAAALIYAHFKKEFGDSIGSSGGK